ncbi:MAG: exodeoxyribonuclease III [Betaproteobacteria bacterium]|jgi:exodeoxyribonuclease-3|nr:exodeoxyribonuclease III [Betaproteobacteria bacterium]
MLRIISLNLNGIRSAVRKGLAPWMKRSNADILCLQELKAQEKDIDDDTRNISSYHSYFHCAQRPGYSGVGIYSKREPDDVIEGLGIDDIDAEGRYIEARFNNLSVISVYVPSGSSSEERLAIKFRFMERFIEPLQQLMESGREVVICGDWNTAHKEIDLKNWKSNKKNSGFMPEEREWIDGILNNLRYVDVFRTLNSRPDQYTWWSNRGQAWLNNVGWRIDYQLCTPGIAQTAKREKIYKRKRFSDHAPLIIDYDFDF